MALPKQVRIGKFYEDFQVNVFDITTKKIVFTGNIGDVGDFLGISRDLARSYLNKKSVRKKQYALRVAKNN